MRVRRFAEDPPRGSPGLVPHLAAALALLLPHFVEAEVPPGEGELLQSIAVETAPDPAGAAALAATCSGTKPVAGPCEVVTCAWGEWAIGYKAAGTVCSDGNACTYGDKCDGLGTCAGTAITCTPRGPCETSTCNGTSSCVVAIRPAGTVCPYSNSGNTAEAPSPCEVACDGSTPWCQP